MLLATAKNGQPYPIGEPTLIVWLAYAALLIPLFITLVWVFFEKWRMTHRLGRFLCAWCVARRQPRPPPLRADSAPAAATRNPPAPPRTPPVPSRAGSLRLLSSSAPWDFRAYRRATPS